MIRRVRSYMSKEKPSLKSHKYLVVPDLHGTYSIYQKVEKYIKNSIKDDRVVIFLGDYLDRGESGKVFGKSFKDAGSTLLIRDLIRLKKWAIKKNREIIFLRGNHERLHEEYYIDKNIDVRKEYLFLDRSMESLDFAFENDEKFYDEYIAFLNDLLPYYKDDRYNYLFIHAGIDPDIKSLDEQVESETIYWIRDKFLFSTKRLNYTVIFGHTPFSKPFMKPDKIGLDSGVYKRDFFNLLLIDRDASRVVELHK